MTRPRMADPIPKPLHPRPSSVDVDFHGSMILRHRTSSAAVWIDRHPVDLPIRISNLRTTDRTFPMPLPGRHWFRRFYLALAWSLGREGRR